MEVRRATAADAEALARIIEAVAPEGMLGREPPIDVEERAGVFRQTITADNDDAMFVLDVDGQVVGFSSTLASGPRGLYNIGMAILSAARGQGGGRRLLEAAVQHAREIGSHKVELEVWPDNARALALYLSCGFAVEGYLRDHYRRRDGSLRSSVVMGLCLP